MKVIIVTILIVFNLCNCNERITSKNSNLKQLKSNSEPLYKLTDSGYIVDKYFNKSYNINKRNLKYFDSIIKLHREISIDTLQANNFTIFTCMTCDNVCLTHDIIIISNTSGERILNDYEASFGDFIKLNNEFFFNDFRIIGNNTESKLNIYRLSDSGLQRVLQIGGYKNHNFTTIKQFGDIQYFDTNTIKKLLTANDFEPSEFQKQVIYKSIIER